ncbi:neutral zinc metallopeptidase [Agromyces atrinae]|uniref:KPN_02809 family neutral zinc metallopeptidase n=1 Tax=Agromyces atrinae TaxID=592376 RepID=UPI001F5A222C|nr:neutral zinc metallopeptidase [Agromyces atrinae]MCI2956184.1 neutral zinc metallopeptidase [Agromyces atrinae]
MTFNPNADISGGKASKRGRTTGLAIGGGGLGVLALVLLSQFFGVDLTGLVGGQPQQQGEEQSLERCQTGADANADIECRMKGASASLDDYWSRALEGYTSPNDLVMFEDATATGCGNATSATGPFYCPTDQTIYLDTDFYGELSSRFGASGGPLAEMYVVAHEWGHHIQNLLGTLESTRDGQTGADSNAVRVELQADCFAGAWVADASTTTDDAGQAFFEPVTPAQIDEALSAAAAVGDDRIQQAGQGYVDPHTFSHGTSEQRQRWFMAGYDGGPGSCETFAASSL